jgi:hypothetical protein
MKAETGTVSETLCFLAFRSTDDEYNAEIE